MKMANDEQKGRTPSSEAAEKERLLKHEEAAKALGKPIYDDMKVSEVLIRFCFTADSNLASCTCQN